jgi:hypothetical protein
LQTSKKSPFWPADSTCRLNCRVRARRNDVLPRLRLLAAPLML